MTAFADALAALHTDPNLSCAVLYRTGGAGEGVEIHVIWSEPVREMGFGESGARLNEIKADVRLADIAEPAIDDRLTKDGKTYAVAAPPLFDTEKLTATLSLKLCK